MTPLPSTPGRMLVTIGSKSCGRSSANICYLLLCGLPLMVNGCKEKTESAASPNSPTKTAMKQQSVARPDTPVPGAVDSDAARLPNVPFRETAQAGVQMATDQPAMTAPGLSAAMAELTQALRKYSADRQRVPYTLNEIIGANYVKRMPQPPPGKKFALDRNQVRVILVDE